MFGKFRPLATAFIVFWAYSAGHASGADLYSPSLKDRPFEEARVNWTGLYFGVHAGYGWSNTDVDLSHSTGAIFYNDPFVPDHGSLKSSSGFIGGLQTGYNYQIDRVVVGLEADFSWSNLEDDGTFTTPKGSQWHIKSQLDDFGTMRGRLGFLAHPGLLIHGTGGLAWGQFNVHQATTFVLGSGCSPLGSPACEGGRTSGTFDQLGFAVGGGAEWMLSPHWTLKGEYLFMDFGKEYYALPGTTTPGGSTPYVETFAAQQQMQVIRAGLNYKF
jgi:outer membrane immunogenic protein